MEEKEDRDEAKRRQTLVVAGLVVVAVILMWFWLPAFVPGVSTPERGTWGDMYGSLNALFSGLAFAGLVIAIVLQTQELGLQRRELAATREEMEGQKLALQMQTEEMQARAVESYFFELLRMHRQAYSLLRAAPSDSETYRAGSEAFLQARRELLSRLANDVSVGGLRQAFKFACDRPESNFRPYFLGLYQVLLFVNRSVKPEWKRTCSGLVRSQLTPDELTLVAAWCLCEDVEPNHIREMVVKHKLLVGHLLPSPLRGIDLARALVRVPKVDEEEELQSDWGRQSDRSY